MYKHITPAKHDGCTRYSVRAMNRHLSKIGQIYSLKGYVISRRGQVRTRVMATGERGKIRFGGLTWGYSGEGPRALIDLFIKLGAYEHEAEELVMNMPKDYDDINTGRKYQVKWEFTI